MMNIGKLSILSWNVRSLGDPTKCALVKDTLKSSKATIVCLQETKLNDIYFAKLNSFIPPSHSNYTCTPTSGSWGGGTLTAWNSSLCLHQSYNLTFSTTVVLHNNLGMRYMITYCAITVPYCAIYARIHAHLRPRTAFGGYCRRRRETIIENGVEPTFLELALSKFVLYIIISDLISPYVPAYPTQHSYFSYTYLLNVLSFCNLAFALYIIASLIIHL
jgi:Endonuclease/Exonuclease/phosphatase family